jgi:hypothetical protein
MIFRHSNKSMKQAIRAIQKKFGCWRLIWNRDKPRVRTHLPSQKMTVAAMQIALKNVCAQRS